MNDIQVEVPQETTEYAIKIQKGLLQNVGEELSAITSSRRVAVVTDKNVHQHYGETVDTQLKRAGFTVHFIILEPGEQTKTFSSMPAMYSELINAGITRSDVIVALGGGVVGDIAGFVAATFLRGIDFVQIPTSLLAQVDSSVGGKVGVDLPEGKNLAGAFYHPKLVIIDPDVLNTLSDHYFSDGMAEVIKYGCIKDASFFDKLTQLNSREKVMAEIENVIETCCKIKQDMVQQDEKDKGIRMLLNFGHTLGHAIEAYYNYESITHGHAVAIGMVTLTAIAEEKGLTEKGTAEKVRRCLSGHNLPAELDEPEAYDFILSYIKKDKKQLNNQLHVVIIETIGQAATYKTGIGFFDQLTTGGQIT
ncbi:MAG: 3-dehydroquinate synthase [Alkalibacterium sp.]|nr:3-dehydroquinate synthase [Alkalibacterium sp.]